MSLRTYLWGITLAALLCWIAFGLVLTGIDPFQADLAGLSTFFVSLFFALLGSFTFIGFWLRVKITKGEVVYAHIGTSFRQGILLSLACIGLLLLQAARVLTWWDGTLLVLAILLVELYFRTK